MAVGNKVYPRTARATRSGATAFLDGQFADRQSDGTVVPATASSTGILGRWAASEYGGLTPQTGIVELADSDQGFAVKANGSVASVVPGQKYNLVVASSGEHQVNVSSSTVGILVVDEVIDADTRMLMVHIDPDMSQALQPTA